MEGNQRDYLSGSILLSRTRDGASPEEYTVRSVIGEGGSTVCYEAVRTLKNGMVETGKLKEFYPVDSVVGNQSRYYSLERLPSGQLIPGTGTVRKFDKMCEEYLNTYKLLWQVMVDNPDNEILKSYIQHGEILYGCADRTAVQRTVPFWKKREETQPEMRATVYIWSPGVAGKGFDDYLEEIRKHPTRRAEERLQDILQVINALTDCIKALHTAGLMHLDIKPSNFLVQYDSDFRVRPDQISLFDINTLCSISSDFIQAAGTEGFCAPEVSTGRVDNRTDIYSIGAMLFHAIVISKEIPDGLYRDSCYENIDQLVRHSALLQASETNSDIRLTSKLCEILRRCLAKNPANRYQSCSELKIDLEKAIRRLTQLLWTPVEAPEEGLTDPVIVMQQLLFEHPLYEAVPAEQSGIHVLVIGSGTYGQKFIDICLQAGQMSGQELRITAVSDQPEKDREDYLRFRPAIPDFISVNGSLDGKEAYAELEFHGVTETPEGEDPSLRFTEKNSQINREIVKNWVQHGQKTRRPYNYVFLALGHDTVNQSIARIFAEELDASCPVCYVMQNIRKRRKADVEKKLYPVCINVPLDLDAIDSRLGEIAFNAHLSWMDTLNIDVSAERSRFFTGERDEDRYNRASSLAFALSLKYKLHSVGLENDDLLLTAEEFSKQILERRETDASAAKKFCQLVDLEHRRWVLERASDGWTAPREKDGSLKLEDCILRGSVKDTKNRTHPCMVRGSDKMPLSSQVYTEDQHRKWDEGDIDPELDELDRMSLELHRCHRRYAEQMRKDGLLQNPDLALIQDLLLEHEKAQKAFARFRFALKNIINGVESYSRQYHEYENTLREALAELPADRKTRIEERLAVVERTFFPVVESNLYRNYKANDETLIEKIPFILTYRHQKVIAMAFEDGRHENGRNEAVFPNVAAATVLSPEQICYLYRYSQDSDKGLLLDKLDAVVNYFRTRKVRCGISLTLAFSADVPDADRKWLRQGLEDLQRRYSKENGNAWFDGETEFEVRSDEESLGVFRSCLQEHQVDLFDGSTCLFWSSYANSRFLQMITAEQIPYFEFDWANKSFQTHIGCAYLKFVKDQSFISIQDMFSLMNATDSCFNLPEFGEDYETLWKIYVGEYLPHKNAENGIGNWNRLCRALARYEARQAPLASISIVKNDAPTYEMQTYFLPACTHATVKSLLQKLVDLKIAGKKSSFTNYTSDTCKLELYTRTDYAQQTSEIFQNPQYLMPYYGLDVIKTLTYSGETVEIRCNDLQVRNANLGAEDGERKDRSPYLLEVLKQLEKAHFISQLVYDESDSKTVSFYYASPRIKKLLTSAGEILEVYAYYDVLKTGYFDDVACGYTFDWCRGGVKNELDLVLTKGFRSIIVECKAVVELKLDYYHKLHSIADHFGIGAKKVLLGNTYAASNRSVDQINTMQRSRGEQLGIVTISDMKEIMNIGNTLKHMMEACNQKQSQDW